jgi:AcrR family transcriptional regulator
MRQVGEVCYRRGRAGGAETPTERLLTVANELFCREGINATGIKQVLAESGVARRTLYKHFGSKENLVRAVLERESLLWLDWFRLQVTRRGPASLDRLFGIFDVLEIWFEDPAFFGCAFINAVIENSKYDETIRHLALAHRERTTRFIAEVAREADVQDAEVLAEQFGLLIDGAIVAAVTLRSPEPARQARTAAQRLVAAANPMALQAT